MTIKVFLCLLVLTINYQLAIAYLGIDLRFRDSILPSLLLSTIAFVSKEFFNTSSVLHTIIIVFTCSLFLHIINKISLIFSIIGSLLSFITLTMGSLLLACPFLVHIGIKISNETNGTNWIYLNIAELVIPLLILIILKHKKTSIVKAFG